MAKKTDEEKAADVAEKLSNAALKKYYDEVVRDFEQRIKMNATHTRALEEYDRKYHNSVVDYYEKRKAQQARMAKLQDDANRMEEDFERMRKRRREEQEERERKSFMDQYDHQKRIDDAHEKALDMNKERTQKKMKTAFSILAAMFASITELGNSGIKLAQQAGLTYAGGVQADIASRLATLGQIFTTPIGQQLTRSELNQSQAALSRALINTRDGKQVDTARLLQFGQNLKKVFGDTFSPTEDTFRSLALTGKLSVRELEDFRKSTGRARLDNNQLNNILTKNMELYLLFGNTVSQAAVRAEQMGLSLQASTNASKGIVTNLEGTLDAVAQLNQLGANIDFGNLVATAEFRPEQLAEILRRSIPTDLLQSTSVRSLAEFFGISSEELLIRQRGAGGITELENSLANKNLVATGKLTDGIIGLTRGVDILNQSLGFLFPVVGAIAGAAVGGPFAPITALIGGLVGRSAARGIGIGNDTIIPSGYGSKAILSPAGTIFLNNNDTVVAGTNLGGGSNSADSARLISKIDALLDTIQNASTVVEVNGSVTKIPRMSMVGVYTRQEK